VALVGDRSRFETDRNDREVRGSVVSRVLLSGLVGIYGTGI
jgi:hypothetical protein